MSLPPPDSTRQHASNNVATSFSINLLPCNLIHCSVALPPHLSESAFASSIKRAVESTLVSAQQTFFSHLPFSFLLLRTKFCGWVLCHILVPSASIFAGMLVFRSLGTDHFNNSNACLASKFRGVGEDFDFTLQSRISYSLQRRFWRDLSIAQSYEE